MTTLEENDESIDNFLERMRKDAISGTLGVDALLHELRKADSKCNEYRATKANKPQDIEFMQALLRFAVEQPDLKFIEPYFDGVKPEDIQRAFESLLEDELEEYKLYNNWHEAAIAFYQYELNRNAKHGAKMTEAIAKNYPRLKPVREINTPIA